MPDPTFIPSSFETPKDRYAARRLFKSWPDTRNLFAADMTGSNAGGLEEADVRKYAKSREDLGEADYEFLQRYLDYMLAQGDIRGGIEPKTKYKGTTASDPYIDEANRLAGGQ